MKTIYLKNNEKFRIVYYLPEKQIYKSKVEKKRVLIHFLDNQLRPKVNQQIMIMYTVYLYVGHDVVIHHILEMEYA